MNPPYAVTLTFLIASLAAVASKRAAYALMVAGSAALIPLSIAKGGLMGYFILISALVWLGSSLFSLDYDHHPRLLAASFAMTAAGMMVIMLAKTAVSFLIGWEVMTIASYFGITTGKGGRKAAYKFLAFGELSFLLILAGFGLATVKSGGVDLRLWAGMSSMAFFLATLGFSIKMAAFPFHTWLPEAHGEAPANLSAQLSALLTLMGLYGMLRLFEITHPASWVGLSMLAIGGVTALIGAAYAAGSDHVKKLPAYSTMENDGVLLALFGAATVAANYHLKVLSSFAFLALLFYAFNHSVSKGLLFLVAGKVERGSGSFEEVERGSLSRAGLIAGYVSALSLAGVPILPGLLAEWMAIETLLQSFLMPSAGVKVSMMIAGAMVALTVGIAGVAMTKMTNQAFQRARGGKSRKFEDAAFLMMSAVLVAAGVFPIMVFRVLNDTVQKLGGLKASFFTGKALGVGYMVVSKGFGGISPTYLAAFIVVFGVGTYAAVRSLMRGRVRTVRPWSGGLTPQEYPPSAHSSILLLTESWLYGTKEGLKWRDKVDAAYESMARSYAAFSEVVRHTIMRGSDSVYVAYIVLALIAVLVLVMAV
ncbi:MAG: NADH-quinone oxidoreductase subunit E [Thermococci archaeon]|nr:NADH-quinone oxidoreductase subunit E [Thermococci archaeon]